MVCYFILQHSGNVEPPQAADIATLLSSNRLKLTIKPYFHISGYGQVEHGSGPSAKMY
jgi:hypothetical protein